MTKSTLTSFAAIAFALAITTLFNACKKNGDTDLDDKPEEKQFMVWAWTSNPSTDYFLTTPSLTQGKLSIAGNGIDIASQIENPFSLTYKDGYFYSISDSRFTKAKIENDRLVAEHIVINRNHVMAARNLAYHFWDGDKLVILESSEQTNAKPIFNIVDTKQMKVVASGTVDIPTYETDKVIGPDGSERPITLHLTSVIRDGAKIFVAWRYYTGTAVDARAQTGLLDYPAMDNVSNVSTTDGYNLFTNLDGDNNQTHTDQEGNHYVIKMNTAGDGRFSYVRIKKGETTVDPSYNFYLDEKSNLPIKYFDLGNNRQIVGFMRNDNPDWTKWDTGYKVVDIAAGKVVTDLNAIGLPFDVGRPAQPVLMDDGKAYIALNGGDQGKYIWEYDPATNQLTKGLELDGGLSGIPYIIQLK